MASSDKKRCMRLDITKLDQAEDVELGDKLTFVVTGEVKSIRGPEEGYNESYPIGVKSSGKGKKEKYIYPGSIEIEVASASIKKNGEFDDGEDY